MPARQRSLPNMYNKLAHEPQCNAVIDEETCATMEYRELIHKVKHMKPWLKAMAKEIQRLSQGKQYTEGTDMIFFIPKHQVSSVKTVTYA